MIDMQKLEGEIYRKFVDFAIEKNSIPIYGPPIPEELIGPLATNQQTLYKNLQ